MYTAFIISSSVLNTKLDNNQLCNQALTPYFHGLLDSGKKHKKLCNSETVH